MQSDYKEKADLWSCGAIMHTLLFGYPPFYGKCRTDICESKNVLDFKENKWNKISENAKNLLIELLNLNANSRINGEEAVNHKWLIGDEISQNERISSNELKLFLTQYGLQRAIVSYISVDNFVSQNERSIKEVFNHMDINGDGEISIKELIQGFKEIYSNSVKAKKEAENVLKYLGISEGCLIDYSGK